MVENTGALGYLLHICPQPHFPPASTHVPDALPAPVWALQWPCASSPLKQRHPRTCLFGLPAMKKSSPVFRVGSGQSRVVQQLVLAQHGREAVNVLGEEPYLRHSAF